MTLYLTDSQYSDLMVIAQTPGQTMSAAVTTLHEEGFYRPRADAEPRQQEQASERIYRRSEQMRPVRQHMEAKRTVARLGAELRKADELRKQCNRLQDRVVLLGEDLQRAMKERDLCREMLQKFLQRRKNKEQDRQRAASREEEKQ